jgi:hypothetical protein
VSGTKNGDRSKSTVPVDEAGCLKILPGAY